VNSDNSNWRIISQAMPKTPIAFATFATLIQEVVARTPVGVYRASQQLARSAGFIRRNAGLADPRWEIAMPFRPPTFLRTKVRAPIAVPGETVNTY
jgi:hypothetical protein